MNDFWGVNNKLLITKIILKDKVFFEKLQKVLLWGKKHYTRPMDTINNNEQITNKVTHSKSCQNWSQNVTWLEGSRNIWQICFKFVRYIREWVSVFSLGKWFQTLKSSYIVHAVVMSTVVWDWCSCTCIILRCVL